MRAIIVVFLAVLAGSAISAYIIKPKRHFVPPIFSKRTNPKIVGGPEVVPHSIPYQAALFLAGHFCGGTLITDRHVLTAGHCGVLTNSPVVVLGAHNVRDTSEETQITINAKKVTVHSGYNPNTLENDLSIIELPQAVTLNENIQPLELAPANSESYEGAFAQTSGWGITSDNAIDISPVLRYFNSTVLSNKECQAAYPDDVLFDSMICIDGGHGLSTCSGDSGGPLITISDGKKIQIGITSFVSNYGCQQGFPDGFTRVTSFLDWINKTIQ